MLLIVLIAIAASPKAQTAADAGPAQTERQLMEQLAQNPEDIEANMNLSKYYFDQAQQLRKQILAGKTKDIDRINEEINRLYGMSIPGAEMTLDRDPHNKDALNMLKAIYTHMGDEAGLARLAERAHHH